MFACVIIIVIYIVLGFMLAWIAAMVAKEDVDVKTGIITLVCSGLLCGLAGYGIDQVMPGFEGLGAKIVANLAILTLMINLIAKLSLKHSAIIAVIYSVVIGALMFGLATCAVDAASGS